jgi:hypothetical protein
MRPNKRVPHSRAARIIKVPELLLGVKPLKALELPLGMQPLRVLGPLLVARLTGVALFPAC